MSASNQLEKYEPPKNQGVSKIYRFPLYRRPSPEPALAPPPVEEPPMAKEPAPPTSTWSEWQSIKCPQWEGYWRASAQEDGGWHYHFTTDGKTVWEQKVPKAEPPKPEAPKPPTASAKTAGERTLCGDAPAIAFTTVPSPSSRQATTAQDAAAAAVKPMPPPALKQPRPPSPPAPTVVQKAPEEAAVSAPAASVAVKDCIPSYTVKKPEPPKPPTPPKKIAGTITLLTKSGKAVTLPLPDPGKPVIIRTHLEK